MKKPLPVLPKAQKSWHCSQTDTTYIYRSWTMGEQELLVQVREDETPRQSRIDTILQIVDACIIEPSDFNVRTAPTFVIESLFLHMYAASMGEIHNLHMKCTNPVHVEGDENPHECGAKIEFNIPLKDVVIKTYEQHKNIIDMPAGYHLKLRYPCLNMAEEKAPKNAKASWVIGQFLECIYNDDGDVWEASDYTPDELQHFIAELGGDLQEPILRDFFLCGPHIYWKAETIVCPKCGWEHNYEIRNLNHVFR